MRLKERLVGVKDSNLVHSQSHNVHKPPSQGFCETIYTHKNGHYGATCVPIWQVACKLAPVHNSHVALPEALFISLSASPQVGQDLQSTFLPGLHFWDFKLIPNNGIKGS